MPHQDDLHTAGMPEDQPAIELLDGAVQTPSTQPSLMGRLLRGSLYCVLLLFASALLAISAVPDLANYVTSIFDRNAGSSRSSWRSASTALNVGIFEGHKGSPDPPPTKDQVRAVLKEFGAKWSSASQQINFSGTMITDADLERVIWPHHDFTRLSLSDTQITDAGLARITGLITLRELDISKTQITDAGLKHLESPPKLRNVRLGGTQVTDAAIEILKGMPTLNTLGICDTQITEAGLEQIQEITNLRLLYVSTNQFTEAGIERLTTALPKCRIFRF